MSKIQESFSFKVEEPELDTSAVKIIAMQHVSFPEKGNPVIFSLRTINWDSFTIKVFKKYFNKTEFQQFCAVFQINHWASQR